MFYKSEKVNFLIWKAQAAQPNGGVKPVQRQFFFNIKATIGYTQVSKQAFRSRNIPKIYQYSPLQRELPWDEK